MTSKPSINEIKSILEDATSSNISSIESELSGDDRIGVKKLIASTKKKLALQQKEANRLEGIYANDLLIAQEHGSKTIVGLDEVGRGCMAGPLAVGAVVLDYSTPIEGLNDSKQVKPDHREIIASKIIETSKAWSVEYVEPSDIDSEGITASLIKAFRAAVASIEAQGQEVDIVLLDGNPLRFDAREVNVIKGDSKCASIAAASIVAKVARDRLMTELASEYPQYAFDKNKGYGTAEHRQALAEYGLSDIHRRSFCSEFLQDSLF